MSKCWLWAGNIDPSNGYGRFSQTKAHRLVYEALVGEIPEGLDLDHLCRIRACVNPEHLEPVTRKVNILRGEGMGAKYARDPYCAKGHQKDRVNINGTRWCSSCHSKAMKKMRSKKKELAYSNL